MNSRMDKYKDEIKSTGSRTSRNQDMYKQIDDPSYDNINLSSNVSVLETNPNDLNINELKDLLEKKYQPFRTREKTVYEELQEEENVDLEVTKEYDLKKVLETAHKNKNTDYDHERFKKLRETQFDILSSLNINRDVQEQEQVETLTTEEANLMNLIKTVDFNAAKNKALKEKDDLFGDLQSGSNTEVLEPLDFDETFVDGKKVSLAEELEKTKKISRNELDEEIKKSEEREAKLEQTLENDPLTKTQELANTFYTGKYQINDDDLDDFSDLENEMKGGSIIIKILIIILVLIGLAVGVYLLNKYLNLGLF